MSDLTRDEIRRACEAVGWKWVETDTQCWAERGTGECFFLIMIGPDEEEDDLTLICPCDAIALLKATGCDFTVDYCPSDQESEWYVVIFSSTAPDGPIGRAANSTLEEAAVRATIEAMGEVADEQPAT